MTQAQLATSASIPRSTVSHMESGAGNPSLGNLARVAAALQVNIESLLAMPPNSLRHVPARQVQTQERSGGKCRVYDLLPAPLVGFTLQRIDMKPGALLRRRPEADGSHCYCHLISGTLTINASGEMVNLSAGDVLAFRADQPHQFRTTGGVSASLVLAALPAPVALA